MLALAVVAAIFVPASCDSPSDMIRRQTKLAVAEINAGGAILDMRPRSDDVPRWPSSRPHRHHDHSQQSIRHSIRQSSRQRSGGQLKAAEHPALLELVSNPKSHISDMPRQQGDKVVVRQGDSKDAQNKEGKDIKDNVGIELKDRDVQKDLHGHKANSSTQLPNDDSAWKIEFYRGCNSELVHMATDGVKTADLDWTRQGKSGEQIAKLVAQEKDAIAKEDFMEAQRLKTEIDSLKSKASNTAICSNGGARQGNSVGNNRINFYSDCTCGSASPAFHFEPASSGAQGCFPGDHVTPGCNQCDRRVQYVCEGGIGKLRLFNANSCSTGNASAMCEFILTPEKADLFLNGGCASIPTSCGVMSMKVNRAAAMPAFLSDCSPSVSPVDKTYAEGHSIEGYQDANCGEKMAFSFRPGGPFHPDAHATGDSSNLCVPGSVAMLPGGVAAGCMPPTIPVFTSYECVERKGTLKWFTKSGCSSGDTALCQYELSESQAEQFSKGKCAIVAPHSTTDANSGKCSGVLSIINRNPAVDTFRGAGLTNDCSQGTFYQPTDNMNATFIPEEISEPMMKSSGDLRSREQQRMILMVTLPIIIIGFLLGTIFICWWYQMKVSKRRRLADSTELMNDS